MIRRPPRSTQSRSSAASDVYKRQHLASYVIGIVGLNELVQIVTGNEMHQKQEALEFGLRVVDFIRQEALRLSRQCKMKFVLGQSLAETTAYRFARLDLRYFSPTAGRYVKGAVSYTHLTLPTISSW